MREHKYRGLTKDGKWVYGSLILSKDGLSAFIGYIELLDDGGEVAIVHYDEVIPSTVGEFTGKKDSKGQDIYGGDRQRWLNPMKSKEEYAKDPYSYCVVKWSQLNAAFNMYLGDDCEVIGNIHQPEGE